ncbi:Type I restriction enzyme EcoKI M protein [Aquisphaera giovannonii]|uniref:Type I restriction enzyme EcoKI M protein n=1 Tax=Aquisphaera giovannonii TaxID=406548 RepID=A0A5B9W4N6_9BACT|nr:N-6 DNA methylase [Aquisphaera giovannonii]QEH35207.1 Type I restriction enzyme EcoKI M protein [Aquisphaera giovannonii]
MSMGYDVAGQRSRLVADALLHVGYRAEHIKHSWKYSNFEEMRKWIDDDDPDNLPEHKAPSILDIAAFYDEREHDWNTISLAAQLNRIELVHNKDLGHQEARKIFADTASPCVLFAGNGTADLWLRCWEEPVPVMDITFEAQQLRKAFEHNRREMERDALAALRGGQRYLFDGWHTARREELATFLNRGITKATWFSQKIKKPLDADSGRALSRIAIGLLAARILEDKGIFGSRDQQSTDARKLLQEANDLADGFFGHLITGDLEKLDNTISSGIVDEMLRRIMAHLTGPASFSMVTAEMLGHLYENALRAQRRQGKDLELNGVYYTPLSLTRNVLARIPVEELPPRRRHALDMACGSGTFLLAASERLRSAFDANESESERSVIEHLRRHVVGNDVDSVALHVAGLTYLLEHVIQTGSADDVPSPALWTKDALDLQVENFGVSRPSIVVGNPPFGRAKNGDQLANQFLSKALEILAPGGFLGMVMPGAFLKMMQRGGVIASRRELLDTCNIMEVWEMPLGVVGLSAQQETCVIIARKKENRSGLTPTLFNVTYSRKQEAIRAQREHLRSTWTFMATGVAGRPSEHWSQDTTGRIIASPIDHVWQKIEPLRPISAICDHTVGIYSHLEKTRFSRTPTKGYYPYLRSQGRVSPYFVDEADWKQDPDHDHDYVDPDTSERPRHDKRYLILGPKLIVTSNTNRNTRIQVKAAFDDSQVFPEHNLYCLGLFTDSSSLQPWARELISKTDRRNLLLWLASILNSPLARAWVAMNSSPRSSALEVFMQLPLPRYDESLAKLVERTASYSRFSDDFNEISTRINQEVLRTYGLSSADEADLNLFLESLTEPWVESPKDAHLPQHRLYRRISGTVVAVDVLRQSVTLDLPRFSRKHRAPIVLALPRLLPGWALREGIEFTCAVPADCVEVGELLSDPWILRDFRPLPYSYLDEEELEELVNFEHPVPAH